MEKLEPRKEFVITGYAGGIIVAEDHTTGDFDGEPWVEEFKSLSSAIKWINGQDAEAIQAAQAKEFQYITFELKEIKSVICPNCGSLWDITQDIEGPDGTYTFYCGCGLHIRAYDGRKGKA